MSLFFILFLAQVQLSNQLRGFPSQPGQTSKTARLLNFSHQPRKAGGNSNFSFFFFSFLSFFLLFLSQPRKAGDNSNFSFFFFSFLSFFLLFLSQPRKAGGNSNFSFVFQPGLACCWGLQQWASIKHRVVIAGNDKMGKRKKPSQVKIIFCNYANNQSK